MLPIMDKSIGFIKKGKLQDFKHKIQAESNTAATARCRKDSWFQKKKSRLRNSHVRLFCQMQPPTASGANNI